MPAVEGYSLKMNWQGMGGCFLGASINLCAHVCRAVRDSISISARGGGFIPRNMG